MSHTLGSLVLPTPPLTLLHTIFTLSAHFQVEHDVFVKLAQCFSAITALGGCPSVTCPIGALRDGSPVSISLFAVHK